MSMANKTFMIMACAFFSMHGVAQKVEVARFLNDRPAALSFTFDDGTEDHYTVVFQTLKRFGLKGSFALIGSRVGGVTSGKYKNIPCMSWEQAREMAEHGQEMTSHGYGHRNVEGLSEDDLRYEVQHNDTLIFEKTGVFPRTYIYPGNRKTDAAVAFCNRDRVCTRTYQISMGGKRDVEWFDKYARELIDNGKWGVTMTHAIYYGYDHFNDSTMFFRIMDRASSLRDSIWIAPLRDVGAYVTERDSVKLSIKVKRGEVIIKPKLNLDRKIYNQPLTILVDGIPYNIDPYARKIKIPVGNQKNSTSLVEN